MCLFARWVWPRLSRRAGGGDRGGPDDGLSPYAFFFYGPDVYPIPVFLLVVLAAFTPAGAAGMYWAAGFVGILATAGRPGGPGDHRRPSGADAGDAGGGEDKAHHRYGSAHRPVARTDNSCIAASHGCVRIPRSGRSAWEYARTVRWRQVGGADPPGRRAGRLVCLSGGSTFGNPLVWIQAQEERGDRRVARQPGSS